MIGRIKGSYDAPKMADFPVLRHHCKSQIEIIRSQCKYSIEIHNYHTLYCNFLNISVKSQDAKIWIKFSGWRYSDEPVILISFAHAVIEEIIFVHRDKIIKKS